MLRDFFSWSSRSSTDVEANAGAIDLTPQISSRSRSLSKPRRWASHRISSPDSTEAAQEQEIEDACKSLTRALGGTDNQRGSFEDEAYHTLRHLFPYFVSSRGLNIESLESHFDLTFHGGKCSEARVFYFCATIARAFRDSEEDPMSSILRKSLKEAASSVDEDSEGENEVAHWVFLLVGFMLALYSPVAKFAHNDPRFTIMYGDSIEKVFEIVDRDKWKNLSLSQLLSRLKLSPIEPLAADVSVDPTTDAILPTSRPTLLVANLNMAALQRIGNIEIRWTDHICNHLHFNAAAKKLYIFQWPSFCHLSMTEDSLLQRTFALRHEPNQRKLTNLMDEILLSYRLLFFLDHKAQSIYRRERKTLIAKTGFVDEVLDAQCLLDNVSNYPRLATIWRDDQANSSFDPNVDLPLLADRLIRIQNFVNGMQPTRFSSLWHDRRDLNRWYAFRALIILGAINIFVGLMQFAAGIGQLYIAQKALPASGVELR